MKATRRTSFYDHMKRALEMIDQPEALGTQSPLAAPYFLGAAVRGAEANPLGWGMALRSMIDRAFETLWGGPPPNDGQELFEQAMNETPPAGRYDCLILELNYLKQRYRPVPRNQAEIYYDILHISRPTHDRHLRSAVERLGAALLQRLSPALHLEQPAAPTLLIGREQEQQQIHADLSAGYAVALSGVGGVGKTAIAAQITSTWPNMARFWYTFRATLNDQLESLLFALGHFLHQRGASALWQQLVAERGRLPEGGLALSLAISDLLALDEPPLLCFDELDILRTQEQDQSNHEHLRILEFLDGLRSHVALLLVGQQAFWASDRAYRLDTLNVQQLADWLDALAIPNTPEDIERLYRYTAGNPRLAELCAALYRSDSGESFAEVLDQLPSSPSLLPLWLRLERRLSNEERRLMHALSVFRSATPRDAWTRGSENLLGRLLERRLVHQDEHGGVMMLPALRQIVYEQLPVELREELHLQAAQIRAERGAYTAAAYHYFAAGQPDASITIWYEQRHQEINQGQAGAALALFNKISQRRLSPRRGKELLLLRAELYELIGEPARVVRDLADHAWTSDDVRTPEAMLLMGKALEAQGQADPALHAYQSGLETVIKLLGQNTQLYVQRSLNRLRQREMQQAWREASLARFHAEMMQGIVNDQSGNYQTAHDQYMHALAIATEADYDAGIAQMHHYLAMLAGRRHDLAAALTHFEQAITFYERVGDRLNREYVRSNLASFYIQVRRFSDALEPAAQALQFFTVMNNTVRIAQNASNLAEAHAELGNLNEAEHYAMLVLQQEEPQSHPYALYTLGTVYRMRENWAQSERYYDQSRRIAEINDDSYLTAFAWRALGEIAQARGDLSAAQQGFAQAISIFRRMKIEEEVRATEQLAAQHDANRAASDA